MTIQGTTRAQNVWQIEGGDDALQVKSKDGTIIYRVGADGTVQSAQQDSQQAAFAALQEQVDNISISGLPQFVDAGTF